MWSRSGLQLSTCIVVACCACGSPTAPCKDVVGRGLIGYNILTLSCTPAGSDLTCKATARQQDLYIYCPLPARDVTDQTVWTSSNSSLAVFGSTGQLKVLGTGPVVISAQWNELRAGNSIAFEVGPGTSPEQLTTLTVVVADKVDLNQRGIAQAHVDVFPQRGQVQACETNQYGSCTFYIFASPGEAAGYTRAQKSGFLPGEAPIPGRPSSSLYATGVRLLLDRAG